MISIGLDLSSYKIIAIEMASSQKGLVVKNAVFHDIESEIIKRGEIQDKTALQRRLNEIWKKYNFSNRKVNVGIANHKVIVKEIELPVINDEEIKNSLEYQINDYIPIKKDNLIYDYYLIERGKDYSKIMLVGAMKTMIMDVVESLKHAKLEAQSIDLNCFALYRVINYSHGFGQKKDEKEKKVICAVNLGIDMSIVEIIMDDKLKNPRFTSVSVNTYIDNMVKILNKDRETCKKLLYEFDFSTLMVKDDKNKEIDKNNVEINSEKEIVKQIIKKTTGQLLNDIKITIEHYLQDNQDYSIKNIIISGENLNNINYYIEKELGYSVKPLNIIDYFSPEVLRRSKNYTEGSKKDIADSLGIGIGMAIRGLV